MVPNIKKDVRDATVEDFYGIDAVLHLAALSKQADTLVMAYPNAGLPNDLAEYDELPETTAQLIGQWLDDGLVNVIGGCCGTTPDHIKHIADHVRKMAPRKKPNVATSIA